MNTQKPIALFLSTALFTLPAYSAEDEDAEIRNFYESNVDNAKYFTLDTAIPTTPGLVLAGATAFDDIGHDLGSDLTYELGFSESGIPQFGVSMRPYWSLFRSFRSSEINFAQYNNRNDAGEYKRGPFHWLKRTQISAGLASTKKDKVEQLGAGLGVLFYPLNETDPRSDEELGECLKAAVGKAFPKVTSTIEAEQNKVTAKSLTQSLSSIELVSSDLKLDEPAVRELYKDEIVFRNGVPTVKPETRLKDVSFAYSNYKTQAELEPVVQELVEDQLGEGSQRIGLIMSDFKAKLKIRPEPELTDLQINAVLKEIGVSSPAFKRDESDPDEYPKRVAEQITKHLLGFSPERRPDDERIEKIIADFNGKMEVPEIRKGLSKSYVDALLRQWLIESPNFEMPAATPRTMRDEITTYLRDRGDVSASLIQSALSAVETEKERRFVQSVSVADINDFLTTHGLDRTWKSPPREVRNDVETYLLENKPDVTISGQTRIAKIVSEEVNLGVNRELEKITASNAGYAGSQIKKCREEAGKRYLGKRELVFGVGLAAKSVDNTFDHLDFAGVSLWTRYRVPIFLSGKLDDSKKPKAPDGHIALFGRFIEDDKITVAEDQSEEAQTWILGVTASAERKNVKFSLGLSYNDRDIVNAMVEDQDFWRISAGWSQRLNERIWLETEFGEILGDAPFNEGAFGRVGLRFDGGLKF